QQFAQYPNYFSEGIIHHSPTYLTKSDWHFLGAIETFSMPSPQLRIIHTFPVIQPIQPRFILEHRTPPTPQGDGRIQAVCATGLRKHTQQKPKLKETESSSLFFGRERRVRCFPATKRAIIISTSPILPITSSFVNRITQLH
ncbi:hypothetical protein, partial [Lentimicrobium sp.]|uniref:hypothetical protein n=1 Tax=Lentimicrobium sp. TaxID=2034841 RepID=UPI00345EA314